MKKQMMLCLILGGLFTGLVGCSAVEEGIKTALSQDADTVDEDEDDDEDDRDEDDEDSEDKDEKDSKDKEDEDEDSEDEDSEDEDSEEVEDDTETTKKSKKSSSNPVLGDEDLDSYEGFEYLIADMLITDSEENEKTGKMERKQMQVFIPNDDYISVSGNRAHASSLGLSFEIELEPYIRYDEEDYLGSENLEYYLQQCHDPFYNDDEKDLVISEVEEVSEDCFTATVEYCQYDSYDEDYCTVFETYYLAELEDDKTILLCIEINANETTGKTPKLIEELEAFYQIDIDWDADRAAEKLDSFLASGGDNTVSTGYFLFTLPDGWSKDKEESTYEQYVYAPDGDSKKSNCMIIFADDYIGYDSDFNEYDVSAFLADEDTTKQLLEEILEISLSNLTVELCDTALGESAKLSYDFSSESISATCYGRAYFIIDGGYLYIVQSVKIGEPEEDPFVILEDILANGQIRE